MQVRYQTAPRSDLNSIDTAAPPQRRYHDTVFWARLLLGLPEGVLRAGLGPRRQPFGSPPA